MKLERLRLTAYNVPFHKPYQTATGTAPSRQGVICQLWSDSGVAGLGECSFLPHNSGDVDQILDEAESLSRAVLGREVDSIVGPNEPSEQPMAPAALAAWAGIETAAWDAVARSQSLPLSQLLNQGAAKKVAVNALLTADSTAAVLTSAKDAIAAGFKTLKLKVGTLPDLKSEQARIAALRASIDPKIKLRLDANGAWDEAVAAKMLGALAAYDIEYIEQPIASGNLPGVRRLRSNTTIKIALDEDVTSLAAARHVLDVGAADYLILKPIALGGVGPTMKIAEAARHAGVACVITTSIDTGVGTALALQMAAALPEQHPAGLGTLNLLTSHFLANELAIEDGSMRLPMDFGLGADIDGAALARFTSRQLAVTK